MSESPLPRQKVLWIKPEYLQEILAGRKTIEVRVGYTNIRRLQAGDILLLNQEHPYRIRRINIYPDFDALVAQEPADRIAPGLSPQELLAALRAFYPPDKEALGAVAIELEPISHAG